MTKPSYSGTKKRWNGNPDDWGKGFYRDIPICKWVKLARDRHIADLKRQRAPDFPYYFDWESSEKAVWFFSKLSHTKGKKFAGQPFILEAWQEWDIVRPLYGWKRLDGTRRYRRVLLMIPKKTGKSTMSSGFSLFGLTADQEPEAEVYNLATKEKQAQIVWNQAKRMVERSPLLRKHIKIFSKSLFCDHWNSSQVPVGRDSKSQDGANPHVVIADEYAMHKSDDLLEVYATATDARTQPLVIMISTAGFDLGSPLVTEQAYAEKVLQKTLPTPDEEYFGYICTVDDPEKWAEPAEWYKANPQLGLSIDFDDFKKRADRARQRPSAKRQFFVKNLNIWYQSHDVWIPDETWKAGHTLIDWEKFKGKRCMLGLDLGRNRDLSAIVLAFMDEKDAAERTESKLPRVYMKGFYFCPEDTLELRKEQDDIDYPSWAEQGFITPTPGNTTRYDMIEEKILQVCEDYEVLEVVIDRFQAHQMVGHFTDAGITVCKHPQTFLGMNFPIRSFEELVFQNRLRHDGDPVLRWMVSNAVTTTDGQENLKIEKANCRDRVDGVVAGVMAVGRLMLAPEPVADPYEEGGGLFVLG